MTDSSALTRLIHLASENPEAFEAMRQEHDVDALALAQHCADIEKANLAARQAALALLPAERDLQADFRQALRSALDASRLGRTPCKPSK